VGPDFLRIRQTDGYEVLYAASAICSIGLLRDQDRAELMAMDRAREQTG
jgi:hypothetical protein